MLFPYFCSGISINDTLLGEGQFLCFCMPLPNTLKTHTHTDMHGLNGKTSLSGSFFAGE